ncbi:MAG: phage virion morphogenesis protein, partial [Rhodocyclaceae bacterium]|nr:phage virion morphogenesis protein [Rhodocyclaceae bacterium]
KKGRGGILYQTGDLSESIASRFGRTFAEVGVSGRIPYAAIHQFGGKAGRGRKVTIPARPFLPATSGGQWLGHEDRDAVLEILRAALERAAQGR